MSGLNAALNSPTDITGTEDGIIYIADYGNGVVRRYDVTNDYVATLFGFYGNPGVTDGSLAGAQVVKPFGVCLDNDENLFVSDETEGTVRFVDIVNSVASTVVGTLCCGSGFSGDGGPATSAQLSAPRGLFINTDGTLFIGDSGNNRVRAAPLDLPVIPSYQLMTFAGTGDPDLGSDDGAPAHRSDLTDVAYIWGDSLGNLYVSDRTLHIVRKVDAYTYDANEGNSAMRIIAGVEGTAGNTNTGDGLTSELNTPSGLWGTVVGADVDLYLCDTGNDQVRVMTLSGSDPATISVFMGGFTNPVAVWGDSAGNIFVLERSNNALQVVLSASPSTYTLLIGGHGPGKLLMHE